MLKVGIIGRGFIGNTHLNIYKRIKDVKIAGIADLNPKKAGGLISTSGNIKTSGKSGKNSDIKIYANAEQMILDKEIDIIDICCPTKYHTDFAVKALERKKHVLCEKPMALNVKDCDKMILASEKSKSKFMIAHCIRFWPEYVYAEKLIKSGKYGKVISADFKRVSPIPDWSYKNWMLKESECGGAVLDLHIHDVDYIISLFGIPKKVFSNGVINSIGKNSGVDYIRTSYFYDRNISVNAEGGWHFHKGFKFEMSFVIRFEKATLSYNINSKPTLVLYEINRKEYFSKLKKTDGWEGEIRYFVDCVKNDKQIEKATPIESMNAVKVVMDEKKSLLQERFIHPAFGGMPACWQGRDEAQYDS